MAPHNQHEPNQTQAPQGALPGFFAGTESQDVGAMEGAMEGVMEGAMQTDLETEPTPMATAAEATVEAGAHMNDNPGVNPK